MYTLNSFNMNLLLGLTLPYFSMFCGCQDNISCRVLLADGWDIGIVLLSLLVITSGSDVL